MATTTTTISWLSRLVLGREGAAQAEAARVKFTETLNGHKFEPETMRAELRRILDDVEEKVAVLSVPPPPEEEPQHDAPEQRNHSGEQPARRGEETSAR